ncbi:MAG: type II toxin-antitoxin system VapC family toxin [Armatimonadota bacterium]|nr:type II toxin-antitoxin system VapC family toxin [Armatimonadota bacterium]
MKILLDTQCWLWMEAAPERLSAEARRVVQDGAHALYLSAASAWEIAIKHALGKLRLPVAPERYVPSRMRRGRILPLPVQVEHGLRAGRLPPYHRDPFDRLLVAQAQLEGLTILTADPQLAAYEVPLIRA